MDQKIRIGFATFDLGLADLHITIGRRYDATEQELIDMQQYVDEQIKPQMPFKITFGNFCYMGENGTFPAYRVYFVDPMQPISSFYIKFYKDGPNKALYPKPKFHITVDSPEKRAALEQVIRQQKFMKLTNVAFKTHIEDRAVETCGKPSFPSLFALKGDWWCPRCNFKIFKNKDRCFKCNTRRLD